MRPGFGLFIASLLISVAISWPVLGQEEISNDPETLDIEEEPTPLPQEIPLITEDALLGGKMGEEKEKEKPKDKSVPEMLSERKDSVILHRATFHAGNKITAKTKELELLSKKPTAFGNLEITMLDCWETYFKGEPDHAALIQVTERKTGASPHRVFRGWMFAENPSLSIMEHPVYDLTLVGCEKEEKKQATD